MKKNTVVRIGFSLLLINTGGAINNALKERAVVNKL